MILTSWAEWAKSFSASSLERKSIVSFEGTIDFAKKTKKGIGLFPRRVSTQTINTLHLFLPFPPWPPCESDSNSGVQEAVHHGQVRLGQPEEPVLDQIVHDRAARQNKERTSWISQTDGLIETVWNLVSVYCTLIRIAQLCSLRSVERSGDKLCLRRWQF